MDDSATSTMREMIIVLHRLVTQKKIHSKQPDEVTVEVENESEKKVENESEKNMEHEKEEKVIASGQKALLDFMRAAGNPITIIESREIWTDLCWTANGYSFPLFQDAFFDLSNRLYPKACSVESTETETKKDGSAESTETPLPSSKPNSEEFAGSGRGEDEVEPRDSQCDEEDGEKLQKATGITEQDIASLSDAQLVHFAKELAEGIKDAYSIRKQNDNTELKFNSCALGFVWMIVVALIIACHYFPDNPKLGELSWDASKRTLWEAFMMFSVEFVWECFLSWLVLRYNVKINYTRKLGNFLKVPKYFVVDLSESVTATALSMTLAFAINFTIFSLISYRKYRERVPFFAYFFLSQDRREDRPDTLFFNGVEDILRFGIYFPFKLLVVDLVGKPAVIFIPIAVNNIGDGLAEPVGVAFGKHKYTVTSIYHKGRFFYYEFTRSFEGSACVFFTTLIVVAANYSAFTPARFWTTLCILPLLMTICEAKAPHANDGPFLALIGCSFLTAVFLIGRE